MSTGTSRPAPKLLAIGAAAVAALGLTACGGSVIKTGQIEDTITKQFAAQGINLKSVDCKDGTKAKVNAAITCTGLNDAGTKLNIEGKVTAIKDSRASFRVKAVSGVAKGTVVSTQGLTIAKQQDSDVTGLTCPAEISIPTKTPVVCAAKKSDGKAYDAKVSIDGQSNETVAIAKSPR